MMNAKSGVIARIAIESDIDGILNLQSQNLYTNLSGDELADGFVTTPFTPELILSSRTPP